MKAINNDNPEKFPGRFEVDGRVVFFWMSAFANAIDYHYVIRGCIWDRLNRYDRGNWTALRKEYDSADQALEDLFNAVKMGDETL